MREGVSIEPVERARAAASSAMRGFLLDSARCLEVRAYYRRFIDFIAERGANLMVWHFTDDQGCSLQFDALPEIASPHAYSKQEMRELIAYAGDRGVEIVPELATLGHCRYLTRLPQFAEHSEVSADAAFSGMCPLAPGVRCVIRRLLEETAEVFPSPNLHVGFDEVNIGGHSLTRAALRTQTRGQILADYAQFLHESLRSLNRRMWMWGDCVLKHEELNRSLPRDVMICNWQYTPDAAPDTTQALLDAGFDVLGCSALISHDQPLYPGEQFSTPNMRSIQSQQPLRGAGRVVGHLSTIWTPVRFIAESLWLGVDLATSIMRDGANADTIDSIRRFAAGFYGLPANDAAVMASVGATLLKYSPMRKSWLSVMKLEHIDGPAAAAARALADQWRAARIKLSRLAPRLKRHHSQFAAFSLCIEILAHAYDAASTVSDPMADRAALDRLIARGQQLLDQLSQTWDAERYADDPRKFKASLAHFQDDHLLPLLETNLQALKQKAAAAPISRYAAASRA